MSLAKAGSSHVFHISGSSLLSCCPFVPFSVYVPQTHGTVFSSVKDLAGLMIDAHRSAQDILAPGGLAKSRELDPIVTSNMPSTCTDQTISTYTSPSPPTKAPQHRLLRMQPLLPAFRVPLN